MTTRVRFFCAANSCDGEALHELPSAQFRDSAGAGVTDPPSRMKIRPERARPAATFAIGNPTPSSGQSNLRIASPSSTAWLALQPALQRCHDKPIQLARLNGTFTGRHSGAG